MHRWNLLSKSLFGGKSLQKLVLEDDSLYLAFNANKNCIGLRPTGYLHLLNVCSLHAKT